MCIRASVGSGHDSLRKMRAFAVVLHGQHQPERGTRSHMFSRTSTLLRTLSSVKGPSSYGERRDPTITPARCLGSRRLADCRRIGIQNGSAPYREASTEEAHVDGQYRQNRLVSSIHVVRNLGLHRGEEPGEKSEVFERDFRIASIMATFDITKAVDENGEIIEPSHEYQTGLVCHPLPFEFSMKPRPREAEALVRGTATDQY